MVLLLSLVSVVGISALSAVTSDFHALGAIKPPPQPLETAESAREPRLPGGAVFRHSVVPGGVFTADEVETAMGRDGIVAAHYSGLNPLELRVETLPEDRAVYMSYRIGDEVFWTKRKVRLKQGETMLTDGANQIRTRCGNRIALVPMEPTADDEPGEMEFDALTDDSDVVQSRLPQGSEVLGLLVGTPLPRLLGDSSAGFAGNDSRGPGSMGIPVFGYAAERTEPEVSGTEPEASGGDLSEIVLFPLLEGDPSSNGFPTNGFPLPIGPVTSNPDKSDGPDDPGVAVIPGDPENPSNPMLPPFENPVMPVPEPATLLLVGGGLTALLARRRRR